MSDQPKPATVEEKLRKYVDEKYSITKPASGEEVIIVNGKPIKVKDIIDKMEDDYRERHGLPDPEE